MLENLRRCKSCGVPKPPGDFYAGPSGLFIRCKACCILARRAAYRRDPDYTKNLVRRYRAVAQARRLAETPSEPQATQAPTAAPGGPKVT